MNAKVILKTVFLLIVLFLLVLIGLHNQTPVKFVLPPLIKSAISQPAAIMYFAFFALGFIASTVLTSGGKKGGGGGKSKEAK